MAKLLNSEVIQGEEFFFYDVGDAVIVYWGGKMTGGGDFVGAFNTKTEAVEKLKAAKIYGVGDSIKITGLQSLRVDDWD